MMATNSLIKDLERLACSCHDFRSPSPHCCLPTFRRPPSYSLSTAPHDSHAFGAVRARHSLSNVALLWAPQRCLGPGRPCRPCRQAETLNSWLKTARKVSSGRPAWASDATAVVTIAWLSGGPAGLLAVGGCSASERLIQKRIEAKWTTFLLHGAGDGSLCPSGEALSACGRRGIGP